MACGDGVALALLVVVMVWHSLDLFWFGAVGGAVRNSSLFVRHHSNMVTPTRKFDVKVVEARLPPPGRGIFVASPRREFAERNPGTRAVAVFGIIVVKTPWVVAAERSTDSKGRRSVHMVLPTHHGGRRR